jgi:hypothetical protein
MDWNLAGSRDLGNLEKPYCQFVSSPNPSGSFAKLSVTSELASLITRGWVRDKLSV